MIVVPPVISASGLASASHSWAGGAVLVGQREDATRAQMYPFVISGNRIQERPATGSSVPAWWFVGHPTSMNTRKYRATVIVGNQSSGTDRGAVVWVGGNDGAGGDGTLNLVYLRVRGQSNSVALGTKMGLPDIASGGIVGRSSGSNALVVPGDTISLEITESGGIYTYTGYKNGIPLPGAVWTDSTAAFGVPGKAWGGGGWGTYSGSYFPSLGVYGIDAYDLAA